MVSWVAETVAVAVPLHVSTDPEQVATWAASTRENAGGLAAERHARCGCSWRRGWRWQALRVALTRKTVDDGDDDDDDGFRRGATTTDEYAWPDEH